MVRLHAGHVSEVQAEKSQWLKNKANGRKLAHHTEDWRLLFSTWTRDPQFGGLDRRITSSVTPSLSPIVTNMSHLKTFLLKSARDFKKKKVVGLGGARPVGGSGFLEFVWIMGHGKQSWNSFWASSENCDPFTGPTWIWSSTWKITSTVFACNWSQSVAERKTFKKKRN